MDTHNPIFLTVDDILVTQSGLRNPKNLASMYKYLTSGKQFHRPVIYHMDDGKYYIHNGHHRLTAMYFAGFFQVDNTMVNIIDFQVSKFQEINHDVGWVTPYNIQTHVRLPNLSSWKKTVEYMKKVYTLKEVNRIIEVSGHFYSIPRKIHSIVDFARNYRGFIDD
jgi:hypothetical protein